MKQYEKDALNHDGELSHNPVVIRLDGNAFHTWTRKMKLKLPFDENFRNIMNETMLHLCKSIPNCVFGYCQSDEISLCLRNDKSDKTEPWFENRIQKLTPISASMASYRFNQLVSWYWPDEQEPAYFDSRVLFMPDLEEVVNCFIWRQNDCMRNSVQSMAQSLYSRKFLHQVKTDELKQMILDKGQSWDDLPVHFQRGSFCIRKLVESQYNGQPVTRRVWTVDKEGPVVSKDKQYLKDAYYLEKSVNKDFSKNI